MSSARVVAIVAAAAALALASPLRAAVTFTVDSQQDQVDANPGDGLCSTAASVCTLRAAVQEANRQAGDVTIQLPAGVFAIEISGRNEDAASTGDFDLRHSGITVEGAGREDTIVDGGGLDRVFDVWGTARLAHLTIRNGDARPSDGGGLLMSFDVEVDDCTLSGNKARFGAAVYSQNLGRLVLTASTVSANEGDSVVASSSGWQEWSGVTVRENSSRAILFDFPIDVTIADSELQDVDIKVMFAQGLDVARTTFSNATFDLNPSGDASITDSVFENGPSSAVTGAGVRLTDGQVNLERLRVSGYPSCGIVLYGPEGATIAMVDTLVEDNGSGLCIDTSTNRMRADLTRSRIVRNKGVGIQTAGSGFSSILTLDGSEVADNLGAGITGVGVNGAGPAISVLRSTVSGNGGAGIALSQDGPTIPSLFVLASTIAGNTGVGVSNDAGPAVIHESTVTDNGGGIANSASGSVELARSILADNGSDCAGTITSAGHNLVESPGSCVIVGDTTGNLVGVDPQLGPLQANGGPTKSRALLAGSAAIDGAGATCAASDQRGVDRPQGDACDIGAFEFACGNATVDPGEQCDDGNLLDGDCCSANCGSDAEGSVCADGMCDGAGSCSLHAVLGKSFAVKDKNPGGDPGGRSIVVVGNEPSSDEAIVGDPRANGATVEIVANGTNPTAQTFTIPAGTASAGSPGWKVRGTPVTSYAYADPLGIHGAVKSASIKKTRTGTLILKVSIDGILGPIGVMPPAPGTDGGMRFTINGGETYCVSFGGTAGGAVFNAPKRGVPLKSFKVVSKPTAPTSAAGCPTAPSP